MWQHHPLMLGPLRDQREAAGTCRKNHRESKPEGGRQTTEPLQRPHETEIMVGAAGGLEGDFLWPQAAALLSLRYARAAGGGGGERRPSHLII